MLESLYSSIPEEHKVAEQWAVTCKPWIEEPTEITRHWAVQSKQEAIDRMLHLYPMATDIVAKKIGNLTSWEAWLIHPDGYMYDV